MLTDTCKNEIRASFKAIASAMPDFRSRDGQRTMIAEVAKTFGRSPDPVPEGQEPAPRSATGANLLCVQAGTGTGKSAAYSVPAAILSRHKKKRLIISTATIALQQQLNSLDIPFFFGAAKIDAKVVMSKGRAHHVCNYRLMQATEDMRQTAMFDAAESPVAKESATTAMLCAMVSRLEAGTWSGDRDAWAGDIENTAWNAITTDRNGCLGQNCPVYSKCAQMAARKRVREADVVITNHSLLLADLANGSGLLGKPEEALFVIDEAHHLPDVAVSAFATGFHLDTARRMCGKLETFSRTLGQAMGGAHAESARSIGFAAKRLGEHLGEVLAYFAGLEQLKPTRRTPNPTIEFELSCVPDGFDTLGATIVSLCAGLMEDVKSASDIVAGMMGTQRNRQALFEKLLADMGAHRGRIEDIGATWTLFLEEPPIEEAPVAKWIEAGRQGGAIDYRMCASPVTASGHLRRLLWEKAAGVVLASATLTNLGRFDHFLKRAGLTGYGELTCIDVPSPFNYAEQAQIVIPKMSSSPKDYDGHTDEVFENVRTVLEAAGAAGILVLFTSRRQMEDVLSRLPESLRGLVQAQGEGSKGAIIARHKARIDAGEPSAIFGLDSMSEGVDLKGRYLEHVIVAKLPFSVPDDPVQSALADWITRKGGNPFMEIAVPEAARKFEQAAGRLIRSETDTGVVTVLDPRLWSTRFGKLILNSLPPFRVIAHGREVRLS